MSQHAGYKGVCHMFCHFMACPQRGRSVFLGDCHFGCSGWLASAAEMFSLRAKVGIRSSALMAFQFQEEDVSSDLVLSHAVVAKGTKG